MTSNPVSISSALIQYKLWFCVVPIPSIRQTAAHLYVEQLTMLCCKSRVLRLSLFEYINKVSCTEPFELHLIWPGAILVFSCRNFCEGCTSVVYE